MASTAALILDVRGSWRASKTEPARDDEVGIYALKHVRNTRIYIYGYLKIHFVMSS